MEEQKPSIGRIVHYKFPDGGECLAAIVVNVFEDESVSLVIWERNGSQNYVIAKDDEWHWPERV